MMKHNSKPWRVATNRHTNTDGTSWGWIDVNSPPKRRVDGSMSGPDRVLLGQVLQLGGAAHDQGESIPAGTAHRREYLCRAAGLAFTVAEPYWD